MDKVDVDFGKKLAMVTMKTGKELDKATVEKAIKDSGFSVSAFGKKSG